MAASTERVQFKPDTVYLVVYHDPGSPTKNGTGSCRGYPADEGDFFRVKVVPSQFNPQNKGEVIVARSAIIRFAEQS